MRWILIGVLSVALVGTAYWGYAQKQDKQTLAIAAENDYQRAFHNLVYYTDELEDHLATVLAMNTRKQLSPKLAEVWRVTSLAQSELSELPLGYLDLTKTKQFLYEVGEFSYKTAVRDLDEAPLTEKEYNILKNLYEYAQDVQKELRKTQASLIKQNLKWLDIEKEMAAQSEPLDNSVIDGFHIVNERMKGYSETDWGAEMSKMTVKSEKDLKARLKSEPKISKEKAKQIALKFLELNEGDVDVQVDETGDKYTYEAYSLTIEDKKKDTTYYMDVTKYGGHPIWIIQSRDVKEQKISLNDGLKEAEDFFNKNGFGKMQLVDSKQFDNIGIYEFVYLHDNVRVYTDRVVLEIALDDGSIIGFDGIDYLLNHKERQMPKPKLTDEDALSRVNPNVNVQEDHLALIHNQLGEEVLCYEFYGVLDDNTYRIFINAQNGEEEIVEKLPNPEIVYDY